MNFKKGIAKKMILMIFLGAFLLLSVFCYFKGHAIVEIRNEKFFVELASDEKKQTQGLSWRENIKENEGMLFNFRESRRHAFWMNSMKFNLDIIWIENEKIVYIAKNIARDFSGTINPLAKAGKVLEIRGGLSEKYGFKIGDSVKIYPRFILLENF